MSCRSIWTGPLLAGSLLTGAHLVSAQAPRERELSTEEGEPEVIQGDTRPPGPSARRLWLAPEAAPARVSVDAAVGIVPGQSSWVALDAEFDHGSGFMARALFASDLRGERRPRDSFGYLAAGYRWRGRYELGAVALLSGGAPDTSLDSMWAAGPGVYVGLGSPLGLRWTLAFGNVVGQGGAAGRSSALAMSYELQVPVLVGGRFRLLLVNRGLFSFSTPTVFAHRVELTGVVARRYRILVGALFDPDAGLVFGLGVTFD